MKKATWVLLLFVIFTAVACKKHTQYHEQKVLIADTATATWKGFLRNGYFNEGTIPVKSNDLRMKDGKVVSGTFKMPLSGIKNLNLPTPELKAQLIHHLQSADFFNMLLYPEVTFKIESVKAGSHSGDGVPGANATVTGELTILGKPMPITFPARIQVNGKKVTLAAVLKVNRKNWGMNYNSDESLPDTEFIMQDISIDFEIQGEIVK